MSDLVDRARRFATEAHDFIGQRRKYTHQPYDSHLRAVAQLVAEVTDEDELIAAAWLHDTVEDTKVTFQELELEFGPAITRLVSELTDVSALRDGNRAVRKALDRAHLANASPRGQTIKLADLIDNCRDICRHDEAFAATFAVEMAALLEVLREGDARLRVRARRTLQACLDRLGISLPAAPRPTAVGPSANPLLPHPQMRRLFVTVFSAQDIAEPLRSFDETRSATEVWQEMSGADLMVAGVRREGAVVGYVVPYDLVAGTCEQVLRPFRADQQLALDAPLSAVIEGLTRHDHVFVELLGNVVGVITKADMQKPPVRMWLFGIITITEMILGERLRARYPGDSWREHVPAARLAQADELHAERARREQQGELLDCLQFADKAELLLQDDAERAAFGFTSRREAKRVVKALESLRNNLAHSQDIVSHDWPQIARMSRNLELRSLEQQ